LDQTINKDKTQIEEEKRIKTEEVSNDDIIQHILLDDSKSPNNNENISIN
jgi:hypothetical protein